ncbi:hypothetical protein [Roseinatronobacter thiooxidans]|uniref:hypothetical protein n=1 Tax=Roseinatronobacter thiooxidans TaxID=121821 RepID=UPI0011607A3F|nr:hypothetical protein [Roseinatronobacter thiooxidans]
MAGLRAEPDLSQQNLPQVEGDTLQHRSNDAGRCLADKHASAGLLEAFVYGTKPARVKFF